MDVSQPIRRPGRTAIVWRDKTIVGLLEEIGRLRDLREEESLLQERTVRRLTPRREVWRWTEKEDRRLKMVIRKWPRLRQQKPYQRNDLIRVLAAEMGRTEMAIYRRIERLRKRMKCSDAQAKQKG
jgi:hypothetical protein